MSPHLPGGDVLQPTALAASSAVPSVDLVRSAAPEEMRRGQSAALIDLTGRGISMPQAARLLTGLLWIGWAAWLSLQPPVSISLVLAMVVAGGGLAIMGAAVLIGGGDQVRRLDAVLITGTIAVVVLIPLMGAATAGYATDELAFDQGAASMLVHGANPYTANLIGTLPSFGVDTGTMRLNGTMEPYISYPALSFLSYVPAVLLFGASSYAGAFVNVFAWALAGWAMWHLLGARLRPWVPVVISMPVLLTSVMTGVTDSLFIPLVIVAVCGWGRFADPEQRRAWRWAGPIALGLACCVKQQPWLLAPFLVAGVAIEARARDLPWWRVGARYAGLAAAAFLLPNVPFVVWNPGAWFNRLLVPFTGSLVPMGLGPAGLVRPLSLGGGNLALFGFAAAIALCGTLALYVAHHRSLRPILPLLPLGALFLSTRSLASYFVFAVPALLVNATTLVPSAAARLSHRSVSLLNGLGAVAALLATGLVATALLTQAPLELSVVHSAASSTRLVIMVQILNRSDRTVRPHFFLAKGEYYNQEFTTRSGPIVLQPGQRANYTFTAVEYPATPHTADGFQVQAGTVSPDTISTSPVALVGNS